MVSRFTIYGERCSGTSYLEELIKENFELSITWDYGFKHFFGFHEFTNDDNENATLFIGIIRDPIDWLNSFYSSPHHLPEQLTKLNNFLFSEFYSIDNKGEVMKEDLNYITRKKYKNVFELRNYKNFYLINNMPKKVKNYVLIKYESLRDKTNNVLDYIASKFQLKKRLNIYKNITYYKKDKDKLFIKKEKLQIPINYQLICLKMLNKKQENFLGYKLY